jgi:predicted oxidoreductase
VIPINTLAVTELIRSNKICVDKDGKRFGNEGISYTAFGHNMYDRNKEVSCIPAYFVADTTHRKKYLLAGMLPGNTPQDAIDSGFIYKADSIRELAEQMGVKPEGLEATVTRFNQMVSEQGVDEEYSRGQSTYEHVFGDRTNKPNPNLGTISTGPFYGAKLWPGDLGTKGGLLTDHFARVVREDGSVIKSLYAAGNSSASVMGRYYAGAGSTLGPAMTFAYTAMDHLAKET